jgi:hypothetical protein
MGSNINDLNQNLFFYHPIYHPILPSKPRRTETFPFTAQRFIVKAFN